MNSVALGLANATSQGFKKLSMNSAHLLVLRKYATGIESLAPSHIPNSCQGSLSFRHLFCRTHASTHVFQYLIIGYLVGSRLFEMFFLPSTFLLLPKGHYSSLIVPGRPSKLLSGCVT
jgi:hypothetical protein